MTHLYWSSVVGTGQGVVGIVVVFSRALLMVLGCCLVLWGVVLYWDVVHSTELLLMVLHQALMASLHSASQGNWIPASPSDDKPDACLAWRALGTQHFSCKC